MDENGAATTPTAPPAEATTYRTLCKVSKHDVLRFCEGDADLAKEVVRLFCERVMGYHIPEMKAAALSKDSSKLLFHLNTLNGSSGYVGAEYLRWLCGQASKVVRESPVSASGKKWSSDVLPKIKELEAVAEKTVENLEVLEI